MESAPVRRSDRVSLTLLLEASGTDSKGQEFKEPAQTLLINSTGGLVLLDRDVAPEQQLRLKRAAANESHREGTARVVGQFGWQKEGFLYGIELLDGVDLWGVEFPPVAESVEAVARMLVECTYCRRREVAYLNDMELRGFEMNRGIARHCSACGVPSIWTQAPHENEKKRPARASRAKRGEDAHAAVPASGEQRQRQRMRLQTRLTACIRQPNTDDELAVCEDISPIGLCFRSKRRYDADSQILVAVPYAHDSANIFVPARVVYAEEIPKAGLFRHGTEYRRPGPQPR